MSICQYLINKISLLCIPHQEGDHEDPRCPWGVASNFAVIFLNFQRLKNLHITNEETKYIFVSYIRDWSWVSFYIPQITADGDCSHKIKRHVLLGRKVMTKLDSILKSRDITLSTMVHLAKAMVFPVVMYGWELDYKESWAQKNWCFWTVVLEKTLESPLDCKEIQPVHSEGNQSWVFIGRTDVEYFGHLMWRTDSFEKTLMLGKIEG